MLGKLGALCLLSAAYFRPEACLHGISLVASMASMDVGDVAASPHSALFVRLVLTLVAFSSAVARTRSNYLTLLALLVCLQTFCLQLHMQSETYEALPLAKPAQLVFFQLLATITFSLVLAVGYFAPLPLSQRQLYRKRLVEFYTTYNPDKLDDVDNILRRYRHHEEVLFTRLKKKYILHDLIEASDDESDDEHETSTDDEPKTLSTPVAKRDSEDNDEEDNEEEDEEPSTPPPSTPQARADTAPRVRTAMQEVQAAQQARIEERIQQLKKAKA
ncbi:hypothetical protein SPRG_05607 [Saprolegnia parasitica CBS 223.65]|uniref:Uncharacterized protein n=1 Tax=Saprolegnia parasitica (strain CBS 223.65) TaxID=695850 RepID=A0A067CKC7_SAPPC|nr:hypothetical protein SPRG_05607 [Saprolegnia parasitica CBS 223.65]KDO29655.1 hypothetical protein SPRG_05607 [Saprolegnia parasitica CBS 223.65]|eukprot:XP_012199714.1 hypothetical protein SPRG_05607 [Saprolegnia parasitica CBS 223.65]